MSATPSFDAIIQDRLYIGNLPAALDSALLERLQITHVLSICYETPSTPYEHATISIEDSEYEDILVHLPKAVAFIQSALDDEKGRVFVHCRMGISRSTTVVCAYLMKARSMSSAEALRFVQHARPCTRPNYGFTKQLAIYGACSYEPNAQHPLYRSWKRRQRQDVLAFLNLVQDTTEVVPGSVFLSSELPNDKDRIECLLVELGITHILSLAPASPLTCSSSSDPSNNDTLLPESIRHFHIPIPKPQASQLVTTSSPLIRALPTACRLVRNAVETDGGRILIYSEIESRACAVLCAYLIQAKGISANETVDELGRVLPLFNPTKSFIKTLQLFDAQCASESLSRGSSRSTSFSSSDPSSSTSLMSSITSDSPPLCSSPPPRCFSPSLLDKVKGIEAEGVDDSDAEEDVARLTKRAARILGGTKMAIHVDAFAEALMKLGVVDESGRRSKIQRG